MKKNRDLTAITAASIEKYLLFNNWVRNYDFPNKNLMIFIQDDEILAVPANDKLADFYTTLSGVIHTLAELQGEDEDEIIKAITTSYHDKIEFRIKSASAEKGTLPLGYAAKCIDGLKDLILYSACAEQHREPICLKITNNAKQILNNFKLGQTEVGSFVINIDIQVVDDVNEQLTLDNIDCDIKVEHKIVKRIGKALSQVNDINNEKISLDDLIPSAYEEGITANMCDALHKLKPENEDAEIETKIRYASSFSQKINDFEVINLKNNHFYIIDEICNRYRQIENTKKVILTGYIVSLKKKRINAGHFQREISLSIVGNSTYRNIKVELDETEYKLACNAHRDELPVKIEGTLDMRGKNWELSQIKSFSVLEDNNV